MSISANEERASILLVDDARLNRELLSTKLQQFGYKTIMACDGHEAIEQLQNNPEIDLIILDLLMPNMDGFDLLQWRNSVKSWRDIPVIINSTLDDWDALSRALDMNVYDYFIKPLSSQDLKLILPLKIRNAIEARKMLKEIEQQNQHMRQELNMAATYQRFLLPQDISLEGVKVASLFKVCSGVAGDYFDIFQMDHGKVGMLVADVSGHGPAAAMTASIVKALMPNRLRKSGSPSVTMRRINSELLALTLPDTFVTAFAAVYDPVESTLTWATAGHPPALLQNGSDTPLELGRKSVFLGMFEDDDPILDFVDQTEILQPESRLCMYTDGLTEAQNEKGEQFGLLKLTSFLQHHRSTGLQSLPHEMDKELANHNQGELSDDVAFIALEFGS